MRPPYLYGNADRDYANSAFIAGSEGLYALWQQKAEAFRKSLGARAILGNERDIFEPVGPAQGTLIFIHGGYWLECSPATFHILLQGLWPVAGASSCRFILWRPRPASAKWCNILPRSLLPPLAPWC